MCNCRFFTYSKFSVNRVPGDPSLDIPGRHGSKPSVLPFDRSSEEEEEEELESARPPEYHSVFLSPSA